MFGHERLAARAALPVQEATSDEGLLPGQVWLAPGDRHLEVTRLGENLRLRLHRGPAENSCRPSADVLFSSAAQYAGSNALGIIMTGMGDDGARGLMEMRKLGAATRAQDEESSVVFGMPKEAIARGAVEKVVSLNQIPREIMLWYQAGQPALAD